MFYIFNLLLYHMPASLYETLIREYLETEGYLVYNNLKIPKNEKLPKGKEIDIFAYSPIKGSIIGEVKASKPNEKVVMEEASKLNKEAIRAHIKETYGINDFKLVLYCWNLYGDYREIRNKIKKLGFDDIITYPQIVKALLENVKKSREQDSWFYDVNRPNTILLQIIYDAIAHESEFLSLKDFE